MESVGETGWSRTPRSFPHHSFRGWNTGRLRDVYDHLVRIDKMIEGRKEMITTAIQVDLGMISLAESETTKRLGSFAALFAVPTMIAGIYGMNFQIPNCIGATAIRHA